jgi:2-dehydro-3-deoxyphosphogluconate aldolase/(4S)-4-hydroxy-2-oxoglutarate aldolase
MPWVRLMPTGGVSAEKENVTAWIQAGAACIGLGSKIISNKVIEKEDYPYITETVRQVLAWVQEARKGIPAI